MARKPTTIRVNPGDIVPEISGMAAFLVLVPEPEPRKVSQAPYELGQTTKPEIFSGNRCTRCGSSIDEGGICICGYDHDLGVDHRHFC